MDKHHHQVKAAECLEHAASVRLVEINHYMGGKGCQQFSPSSTEGTFKVT